LDEDAAEAEPSRNRRDLPRVVRLHAVDRDERVASLSDRFGGQVLELANLVTAVRKPRVAVLALRPELDLAPEMLAQTLELMDRRRSEEERDAVEPLDAHCGRSYGPSASAASAGALSRLDEVDDAQREGREGQEPSEATVPCLPGRQVGETPRGDSNRQSDLVKILVTRHLRNG
jgi:hypothetical protein